MLTRRPVQIADVREEPGYADALPKISFDCRLN
jgi:hypothetical protein